MGAIEAAPTAKRSADVMSSAEAECGWNPAASATFVPGNRELPENARGGPGRGRAANGWLSGGQAEAAWPVQLFPRSVFHRGLRAVARPSGAFQEKKAKGLCHSCFKEAHVRRPCAESPQDPRAPGRAEGRLHPAFNCKWGQENLLAAPSAHPLFCLAGGGLVLGNGTRLGFLAGAASLPLRLFVGGSPAAVPGASQPRSKGGTPSAFFRRAGRTLAGRFAFSRPSGPKLASGVGVVVYGQAFIFNGPAPEG